MSTLVENLRVAQPEIEPLHMKQKDEAEKTTKVPIGEGAGDNDSVYNQTTVEKPRLRLRSYVNQVSDLH